MTEELTPSVDASKVGIISVDVRRCKKGKKKACKEDVVQAATAVAGPMQKKSALIGAVTEYALGERMCGLIYRYLVSSKDMVI